MGVGNPKLKLRVTSLLLYNCHLFRFIVAERLNQLRGFGGVRIEDDVIVREHGAELMSIVPR